MKDISIWKLSEGQLRDDMKIALDIPKMGKQESVAFRGVNFLLSLMKNAFIVKDVGRQNEPPWEAKSYPSLEIFKIELMTSRQTYCKQWGVHESVDKS